MCKLDTWYIFGFDYYLRYERREIYKSWYVHIELNNGLCVIFPLLIDLTPILGDTCVNVVGMYVVFLVCVCVFVCTIM